MAEYSDYQKKIIKRFYDNREGIDATRLSELATDLFLAEGKKKDRLWKSAAEIMTRLGVPPTRLAHTLEKADPRLLAEIVNDVQKGLIQPPPKPNG